MRRLTLLSLLALPMWAQVGPPVLGYLPDGARLRPVHGIPAAAAVLPALDAGREFARAAVSPKQDFVLASAADNGEVLIARPGQGMKSITGASASPDAIVVSPSGTAAALWYSSNHHVQIVKGLPDAPEVRDIDATFLNDAPAALAVSDDAEWLAGAWALGLHAFGPHGEVNRVQIDESATALAFFHGSHDLAAATGQGVYTISDAGGRNLVNRVLPVTAAASYAAVVSNNRRVILATTSGQVTSLDLDTGATAAVDCACAPEGLFPMGRAFRLTGLSFGAFKLFDADTGEVLFAPLAAEEGARQ
jgi:hypothetical protein